MIDPPPTHPVETAEQDIERRFPRRFLLAATGTVAAVGVTQALSPDADAASGTTAWALGGNAGVATNGSNFLGPTNAAPLIFKTRPSASGAITERMRITPAGTVGVNVTSPGAQLHVSAPTTTHGVKGSSVRGIGVFGTSSNSIGVQGTSNASTGVKGISTKSTGVRGTSATGYGVYGSSAGVGGEGVRGESGYIGVHGRADAYGGVFSGDGAAEGYGLYATGSYIGGYHSGAARGIHASGDTGVYGAGTTYGIYGTGATGVYGTGSPGVTGHGGAIGVYGGDASNSGVRGDSTYVGMWGTGASWGVYGQATATTGLVYGVFGATDSADGFGIYSDGNAHVNGTLSKLAGSFKIDHPLDPKHKWLSHSFVESPDMMNVYNGNVTLDGAGSATVDLPSYFDALNRDYRYQLTPIGAAAPDLHVASEIKDNSFTIAGGPANGTVSWQVTGIRKDAYAEEHPIVVEEDKGADASGKRSFVPKGGSRAASADQALRPTAVKVPHHPRLAEITPRIKHTP